MYRYFNKLFTSNNKSTNEPTVVWIHGANQSSLSFSYLLTQLPEWKNYFINYSSNNGFYNNLTDMISELQDIGPVFLIGHSLGGIYNLHLLNHLNVKGVVSISTPFRGSSTADWAKYIVPHYRVFKEVGRRSKPIVEGNQISINVPWTQIISTSGGVPYHSGPNDSVVTIASMEHRKNDMNCVYVPYNHYEVVCSKKVADIIAEVYYNTVT